MTAVIAHTPDVSQKLQPSPEIKSSSGSSKKAFSFTSLKDIPTFVPSSKVTPGTESSAPAGSTPGSSSASSKTIQSMRGRDMSSIPTFIPASASSSSAASPATPSLYPAVGSSTAPGKPPTNSAARSTSSVLGLPDILICFSSCSQLLQSRLFHLSRGLLRGVRLQLPRRLTNTWYLPITRTVHHPFFPVE